MSASEDHEELEDQSALEQIHWLFSAQFDDSKMGEIKSALTAISIGTAVLTFTTAISAFLLSPANWLVSILFGVAGLVVILFVWFLVLDRFDWLLQDEFDGVFSEDP